MKKTMMIAVMALAVAGCVAQTSLAPERRHAEEADKFAIGADISGATYLEARGYSFTGFDGKTGDVFRIMKEMGVNAVRLRVWVDHWQGWCCEDETAAKAKRAADAGLDVMLDFHYSDDWADPGNQTIPKAWSGKSAEEVDRLLYAHTRRTLEKCKAAGANVKWVQIGNEVAGGMLWTPWRDAEGKAHWEEVRPGEWSAIMVESLGNNVRNPDNWAMFFKTGARAVKEIFPEAKTIIHLPNAHDTKAIADNLNILKSRGVVWDIIGVSLYTHHEDERKRCNGDIEKIKAFDQNHIKRGVKSIRDLYEEFKTPVMIVETGFEIKPPEGLTVDYSAQLMAGEMKAARKLLAGICTGVFYWEPTSLPEEYPLGAFIEKNKILSPTSIMNALTGRE